MSETKTRAAVVLLLLGVAGLMIACGGTEPPAEEPSAEPDAAAATVPSPPPEQDFDIDPNGTSIGNNALSTNSTLADDKLSPLAFGTVGSLDLVVGTQRTPLTSITLVDKDDSTKSMTISGTIGGSLSITAGGQTVTAYDPSTVGNNCYLMSDNLAKYFQNGNTIQYSVGNNPVTTPLSGNVGIEIGVTPAADCP